MTALPTLVIAGWVRPQAIARVAQAVANAGWAGPTLLYLNRGRPDVPEDAARLEASLEVVTSTLGSSDLVVHRPETHRNVGAAIPEAVALGLAESDAMILLEDDCVPAPDFFLFMVEMLERHADDRQVWTVSGCNIGARFETDADYVVSRFSAGWGWGTWRDRWANFEPSIRDTPARQASVRRRLGLSYSQRREMQKRWESLEAQAPFHTWDFSWQYAMFAAGAGSIVPVRNLVTNIGFGPDAAHTTQVDHRLAQLPLESLPGPWRRPDSLVPDPVATRAMARQNLGPPMAIHELAAAKIRRYAQRLRRRVRPGGAT